ncbi:MAG: signal peptidase I [Halorubrum sp. J07HR59]|nr:MAG: signal peptidase I [Halorubrum sp. J07HR59]
MNESPGDDETNLGSGGDESEPPADDTEVEPSAGGPDGDTSQPDLDEPEDSDSTPKIPADRSGDGSPNEDDTADEEARERPHTGHRGDSSSQQAESRHSAGETGDDTNTQPEADDTDWVWGAVQEGHHSEYDEETSESISETADGPVQRFRTAQRGPLMWIREVSYSAAIVFGIGLLLFGISGVWPPMVAVQSGSMEPNMEKGDLVVLTEPGRLAPGSADDAGIVTQEVGAAAGYRSFGNPGSVVVYDAPGGGPPTIHRVHLAVEDGENWVATANPEFIGGRTCDSVRNCPAPHDGYLTKGDNNARYDQVSGIAPMVRESWVTGVARFRIPYLGWIRLFVSGAAAFLPASLTLTLVAGTATAGTVVVRSRVDSRSIA